MRRMVVDKNMLEDPQHLGDRHPLRAWLAASKDHVADNIEDATAWFTDEEFGILRRREPHTDEMILKILDGTIQLAEKFYLLHPDITKPLVSFEAEVGSGSFDRVSMSRVS